MKQLLPLLSLVLWSYTQQAQTVIMGKALAYPGQIVRVLSYQNHVTYETKLVTWDTIDKEGNFELKIPGNHTFSALLDVSDARAQMYVEPNRNYEISYYPPSDGERELSGEKLEAALVIQNDDSLSLNNRLTAFYNAYDAFMVTHYPDFLSKRAGAAVDSFATAMLREFGDSGNVYLFNSVRYTIASMRLTAFQSNKQVFEAYIKGRIPDYNHEAEMHFINQFYNQYFSSLSGRNQNDLRAAINDRKSLTEAKSILAREPFSADTIFNELVLMIGLYETYYSPEFTKEGNLSLLKQISQQSLYEQHRAIAEAMLRSLTRLTAGSKAPAFTLPDKNGKMVSLSDFRGKYVYLDFWATWCTPCLQEMKLMPDLQKEFGKDIEFVSVSIDKDAKAMQRFLVKNPQYKWTFLHYEGNQDLKDVYNVRGVPMYFLIDREGVFVQSPALRPGDSPALIWERILNEGKVKKPAFRLDGAGE